MSYRRGKHAKVSVCLLIFLCLIFGPDRRAWAQGPETITVAAASDMKFALEEIAKAYRTKTGVTVRATYGSSGNFYAQISNGAPFDVFLSADLMYPQKLADANLVARDTLKRYARGKLVLWIPAGNHDLNTLGLKALASEQIRRVAIANPKHAPYGRAAQGALERAGLWQLVQPKLVIGENIAQTAQFVESKNADAGLVALSLVKGMSSVPGVWIEIPLDTYPALDQAAAVTKVGAAKRGARDFVEFLAGPEAKAILQRFGFAEPSSAGAR